MAPRKLIPLSKSWTRGTPSRHYLRGPCRFAQIQLKGRTERQLQSLYRAIENALNEWVTKEVGAENGQVILPWGPINERPIDALDIISHCLADKRPRFENLVAKHSLANIYAVLVLKSAASVPGPSLP